MLVKENNIFCAINFLAAPLCKLFSEIPNTVLPAGLPACLPACLLVTHRY